MTQSPPDPHTGRIGAQRCVTTHRERAPQRTPRFPDTAWGRLRGDRGWSLRELAARSGLNIADLSRIERGLQGATPDQAAGILGAYQGRTLELDGDDGLDGLYLLRVTPETYRLRSIDDPAENIAERRRTIGSLVDRLDDDDN